MKKIKALLRKIKILLKQGFKQVGGEIRKSAKWILLFISCLVIIYFLGKIPRRFWDSFLSRLAISAADAAFWVIIIVSIGITGYLIARGIINHLLEDVPTEEEE